MNTAFKILPRLNHIRMFCNAEVKAADVLPLHVSNLPWTVSQQELEQYFAKFGPIVQAHVEFDDKTGLSRGFGYVKFSAPQSYRKALETRYHMLEGRMIQVAIEYKQNKTLQNFFELDKDV